MKRIFCVLLALVMMVFAFSGFTTTPPPQIVRVGLLRLFYNQATIHIASTNIEVGHGLANGSFSLSQTLTSANGFTVQVVNGQVALRAGNASGNIVFTFNSAIGGAQVRGVSGGTVTLGNYTYRGVMEFHPYETGRITAVNVIDVEDYILGALPLEMSPTQFHPEALRAQAVAARTFSIHTRDTTRRHSDWLDLCDRPQCCQSYRGVGNEHENTTAAVQATHRLMMFLPGSDIAVFTPFSASSGGVTSNSEHVWWAEMSHLRGVPDPYEPIVHSWTRSFTWAELTTRVANESPASVNIGNVTAVAVTNSHLGRIVELTFTGTNGEWSVRGERMRTMMGFDSQNFTISGQTVTRIGGVATVAVNNSMAESQHAPSSLFAIDHLGNLVGVNAPFITSGLAFDQPDSGANVRVSGGTSITVAGRGRGHGVGMSQHGANGMANAGHDFRAILQHYYRGVEIR